MATWRQLKDDCPALMKRFADMGVKGFKVDFFDRADQTIIASVAHIAQTAADNRILFHAVCRGQACIVPGAVAVPIRRLQVGCLGKQNHQVDKRLHDCAAEKLRLASESVNRRLSAAVAVL